MRPRRIVLYLIVLSAPLVLGYVAAQTAAAMHGWFLVQAHIAQHSAYEAYLLTYKPGERVLSAQQIEQYRMWDPVGWEARVKEANQRLEAERADAASRAGKPIVVQGSIFHAILEAIFKPAATTSRLAFDNAPPYASYPPPSELWPELLEWFAAWVGGGGWGGAWRWLIGWLNFVGHSAIGLLCGLALALSFPFSLALLPMSRKKAKVRWAHIARVTAYGCWIPIAAVFLVAFILAIELAVSAMRASAANLGWVAVVFAIGAIPLGTMLWWCFAINRHLKMPHALAVTAMLFLVCALTGLAGVYLFAPQWIFGVELN